MVDGLSCFTFEVAGLNTESFKVSTGKCIVFVEQTKTKLFMKKFLTIIAAAALFAACSGGEENTDAGDTTSISVPENNNPMPADSISSGTDTMMNGMGNGNGTNTGSGTTGGGTTGGGTTTGGTTGGTTGRDTTSPHR